MKNKPISSADGLREKIAGYRGKIAAIQKELDALEADERAARRALLQPLVRKCFRGTISDTHYFMFTDVPQETMCRGGVSFNPYCMPAVHFFYSKDKVIPFDTDDEAIFWFESVFLGELPPEFRLGAKSPFGVMWEPCSTEEFCTAFEGRVSQFRKKFF